MARDLYPRTGQPIPGTKRAPSMTATKARLAAGPDYPPSALRRTQQTRAKAELAIEAEKDRDAKALDQMRRGGTTVKKLPKRNARTRKTISGFEVG